MDTERHERQYQAYQALKGLIDLAAETMKQIAYEQMEQIDWEETCRQHRDAFARWIEYADAQIGGMRPTVTIRPGGPLGSSVNAEQRGVLGCAGAGGQRPEAEGEACHGVPTGRSHQQTGPSSLS